MLPVLRNCLAAGLFGLTLLAGSPAADAQDASRSHAVARRRHHDHYGRAYYLGPLRVSAGVGTAFYNGDLGNSLGDDFLGPALNLGVLYGLGPHWRVGGELGYFSMGARDYLPSRGLAFHSNNGLGTVFFRYDLLGDPSVYATPGTTRRVQPFVQAGLGALLYDPRAYQGTQSPDSNTQYLPTERNDYPGLAAVLPIGAGVVVPLTDQLNLTLEGNYYLTSTDYLDDISQRGNPNQKDGFGTLMLKLDYALGH
ncbi:outer membrane beta-barrel protein [Hymenobacter caeli]|uniref:Outer membrane protein beta-barrel domain-containing protein n=1 Tax=Hymenobacter caeli TaxID=2735894 RepID=A0ABX2FN69_9BACT|nr:outer membrane beta-barrel protein [Hymenobacter caeli]NRT18615.1 hypothetical protein [Hymenobacter caeli]